MKPMTRRTLLVGGGAVAGGLATAKLLREDIPRGRAWPPQVAAPDGATLLDDASALNPTPVARHITITEKADDALIALFRRELAEAKSEGRPFVVHAARHSMGGQSLARNATALTLDQNFLEPDTANGICRVSAGIRWADVIANLDPIGFSPKVMQSNNDFGVASTFCVNAHGWPVPHSAFGSTVRSLRLMTADGDVVTCSRSENADLFNMTMGGYGMTGAIIDLEMEMAENRRLEPTYTPLKGADLGTRFIEAINSDPAIEMAYGRLDITIDGFFEDGLLITYKPAQDQSDLPAASGSGFLSKAARPIFRAQPGSDRVKRARWYMETAVSPAIGGGTVTRNSLINEPVVTLDDRDPTRTDILHEYFVPPERFADFVTACREVIPSSYQELLNITLRFVDTDRESWLAYATTPRIAAVMLFSQEMTLRGEADMARMTSALIERVIDLGGAYYLPYRLHATDRQFLRTYPRSPQFAARKREIDPGLVFTNLMWDRYFAGL
ncbi:MAG: FAD-binding oxidoreductase [Nitratireductor sp.]|nr:FAD-binding oxidoreductase [Nitratireductor sp.]